MVYNMTLIENSRNIVDLIGSVNTTSNNWLINGLVVSFFIVYLLVFHKDDFKNVFLADSFITFIICSLMFAIGWIGWSSLIIPIIFIFTGVFMYMFMN